MAIEAPLVDGNFVSGSSLSTSKASSGNQLDKDAFLQLLVAEMKYQDPLEPASNTDYIAQLATFSQVEEMQNMSSSIQQGQASDLVGKRVIMTTTSASGETGYKTGIVDCIEIKTTGTYLSIDDNLYNIDNLYSVVDDDYYSEITKDGSSTGTKA